MNKTDRIDALNLLDTLRYYIEHNGTLEGCTVGSPTNPDVAYQNINDALNEVIDTF